MSKELSSFNLLERFNAIAFSHAIPEGIFRVNAGYGILSTSEEGSEDGHTEHMGNL